MDNEEVIMQLIVQGGNCRSLSIKAIQESRKGNLEKAQEFIEEAKESIGIAHEVQTKLIQEEAAGNCHEVNLLMVHAQDHLMNALTVKDLAIEQIEICKEIIELKKQVAKLINK